MYKTVILSLLRGEFQYEEAGILDRTHIRFFTWNSICQMLHRCGLVPTDLSLGNTDEVLTEKDEELLQAIYSLRDIAPQEHFETYQYIFSAGIAEDKDGYQGE